MTSDTAASILASPNSVVLEPIASGLTCQARPDLACHIQTSAAFLARWLASQDSLPIRASNAALHGDIVALGIPTTSKGIRTVSELALLKVLTPSLLSSVSRQELLANPIILMIGFDAGDALYEANIDAVYEQIMSAIALAGFSDVIAVHFYRLPAIHRVAQLWNMLFGKASLLDAAFFYQLNDDVRLETPRWLPSLTSALISGASVAGPGDPHNGLSCRILTQAMVPVKRHARNMLARHGHSFLLYPLAFADWKSDRWLTHFYGARMRCLASIVARNGQAGDGKCRYAACDMPRWRLEL